MVFSDELTAFLFVTLIVCSSLFLLSGVYVRLRLSLKGGYQMNLKNFMDKYEKDNSCIVEFFNVDTKKAITIQEKYYSRYEVVNFGVFLGDLEVSVRCVKL